MERNAFGSVNATTQAIKELETNFSYINAIHILKKAQFDCEEMFISAQEKEESEE